MGDVKTKMVPLAEIGEELFTGPVCDRPGTEGAWIHLQRRDEQWCSIVRRARWRGRLEGVIAIWLPLGIACLIIGWVMR